MAEPRTGHSLDSPSSVSVAPSFAVVLKAHAWDGFIERQLHRFEARVGSGRLFLLVDETEATLGSIPWSDVIRTKTQEAVRLGLADRSERNSLFWWNTDYPHYIFFDQYPDFDYYVFVEYDSLIQCDIDELVADIASKGTDFVAMPTRGDVRDWMWTKFHSITYQPDAIRGSLNCLSILSRRAVRHFYERRLQLSAESAKGTIAFWPFNEVFMAAEIDSGGLKFESLAAFGNVDAYEWFPPYLEDDVQAHPEWTFIHPILDRERYIASLLRFEPNLLAYHRPGSALRRNLARFDEAEYRPLLWLAFFKRTLSVLDEHWDSFRCRLRLRTALLMKPRR